MALSCRGGAVHSITTGGSKGAANLRPNISLARHIAAYPPSGLGIEQILERSERADLYDRR